MRLSTHGKTMPQKTIGLLGLLLSPVLFLTFAAGNANGQQWSQWRGPQRANHCAETKLFEKWGDDGPEKRWTTEGLGRGYGTVTIAESKIFVSGNTEIAQQVSAYDINGKQLWATAISDTVPKHSYLGSRSTPTFHDGKLYVVSSDGRICCLEAETGDTVWTREFSDWDGKMMSRWGYSESPLVDGENVICTPGGPDGMVVALKLTNGEEVWASKLPDYGDENGLNGKSLSDGAAYSSLVISEGGGTRQYIQLVGRGLIGVRASDGKLLWRYKKVANGTANIPTAIVDGDYVFTSTGYNTGSALLKLESTDDGVNAEEVYWLPAKTFQNKIGGITLVDGFLYAGHGNGPGLPICVEMKTGKVKWGPVRADGKGESSLLYADGHLIWRRQDGRVILTTVNSEKFDIVSDFMPDFQEDNSWSQPVIAGGVMYLREQDKLMAYQAASHSSSHGDFSTPATATGRG